MRFGRFGLAKIRDIQVCQNFIRLILAWQSCAWRLAFAARFSLQSAQDGVKRICLWWNPLSPATAHNFLLALQSFWNHHLPFWCFLSAPSLDFSFSHSSHRLGLRSSCASEFQDLLLGFLQQPWTSYKWHLHLPWFNDLPPSNRDLQMKVWKDPLQKYNPGGGCCWAGGRS